MSLEQFAIDMHNEVLARCTDSTTPQSREEIFTELILELLNEHNEADGVELCYYEARNYGRISAARLSAWSVSGDGATVDLFVTLYHGDGIVQDVGKAELRKHFKLLSGFLSRALAGFHTKLEESSPAFGVMQDIYASRELLTTVRLFFLTDGVVRSLDLDEDPFQGLEVRYAVWDLEKLSRLSVGHREVISLDFQNTYGGSIPCIVHADPTGEYRTFLAYFPAPLLARIYGEFGQRLLERNVRAFLQARGKINRGLQKTIKEEPHRFLAYNNGLCCTAAQVKVAHGNDHHGRLEWVGDFQIVNGGQTTASIFHALKKEKVSVEQVVVQVKLTVLKDPEMVSEVVPLISLYANSQNKVNGADFAANGRFHQTLEHLSRSVWAPPTSGLERGTHWYYERARGSYADDRARQGTPAKRRDWESQNPLRQKFTKTDLAKYEHAWQGLPHLVCLGAEKNFNKYAESLSASKLPEVDQTYFWRVVSKAILWRTTERLFDALKLPQYRAQTVAYALAWLASKSNRRIDLDHIWRNQKLSRNLCEAMSAICECAHNHILSQTGNQSEACKKEHCWIQFKSQQLSIPQAWTDELLPYSGEDEPESDERHERFWEEIRGEFKGESRTIGELEAMSGKRWNGIQRAVREVPASFYANKSWMELHRLPRLGSQTLRALTEILASAAEES